jgi:hypothetical protein
MTTNSYHSWRREMGAISRGMIFIEGNLATPAALDGAEPTVPAHAPPAVAPISGTARRPILQALKKTARQLYWNLLFLGGRPMTAGHNDDIDEPFPQTDADEPHPRPRRFGPPSSTCATC